MISRIILLAVIAIISVAAYFAGSGAFKPYSAKLFDLFSQRTAPASASLPKEETFAAAATNSDHDQLPTPNDFSRSPERPLAETQTQTAVAAAKSMAAPQTTASLPKEALATAATNSDHDQVSAPNDLSRSPERPVVDTQTQTPVASAKSTAGPQTTALLPKEKALATAATNSDHDQVSASNDLSRSPGRPVVDTPTQTPVAAAKSAAVGDVSPRQPDGTKPTIQGVSDKEILFGIPLRSVAHPGNSAAK